MLVCRELRFPLSYTVQGGTMIQAGFSSLLLEHTVNSEGGFWVERQGHKAKCCAELFSSVRM